MVTAVRRERAINKEVVQDMGSTDELKTVNWRGNAFLICTNEQGGRKYLRQATMEDLLSQVREREGFKLRSLRLTDNLSPAEFYLALGWMKALGLVKKVEGGNYVIDSIEAIRKRWNAIVQEDSRL